MLVSFLAIFVSGAIMLGFQHLSMRRHLVDDLSLQAKMVAENCALAGSFNNIRDAEALLASLHARESVAGAWLLLADGSVFARYLRQGRDWPSDPPLPALSGPRLEDGYVVVSAPVMVGPQQMATVCLVSDLSQAAVLAGRGVGVLGLAIILSMIVVVVLSHGVQRVLSGPILELAAVARTVSQTRDFTVRAGTGRDDEVGELSSAFNEMLEEIQLREAALKNSEERFRSLVETTSDWIWELSPDRLFTYASPRVRDLLGYEPEEVVGKTPFDFMPAEEVRRVRQANDHLLVKPQRFDRMVHVSLHKSGREVVVETSGVPVFERGEFKGYRGIDRDVTARMETEGRRRFLAGIVEQVTDGVATATLDGNLTFVNRSWAEMHGYSCDELVGENLSIFHTEKQLQEEVEPFHQVVLQKGAREGEIGHVTRGGEVFPTFMTTTLLRNDEGEPIGFVGVGRDISESKRAEEELRTRGRFLACLSEVAQRLIGARDAASVFNEVLGHLGRTVGVSRTYIFYNYQGADGELLCSLLADWAAPGRERLENLEPKPHDLPYEANGFGRWIEVLGGGEEIADSVHNLPEIERPRLEHHEIRSLLLIPLFAAEVWYGYIGFDDCERTRQWQDVEVDLLKVAAAEISAAIDNGQLLDRLLDDAMKLEERVAERTSELSAVNRELEAFSYSVSHDLRAPLRSIDGFSQAFLEDFGDTVDEVGRDYLRRVRGASQRMGRLIDDLLLLSRLSRRQMVAERVDLSSMAHEVVTDLRLLDPEREVEVVIDEGLVAMGDSHLLSVALENLLGNAWKFTSQRDHPQVELSSSTIEGEKVFIVRDNGAGFDMAQAGRLFGAFQRMHSADVFEGTGVGLATVQRIIHRHGGRIWAEGIVDGGATFFFTL